MNYHFINVKKTLILRNINVRDRVFCNLIEKRFFFKFKFNIKHYEFSKILKIILKYKFFQYVNDIKFHKIVVREIEIKIKVDVKTVVNKKKKIRKIQQLTN